MLEQHGFEPKNCRHLKNMLYDEISEYCMRLEDKMNIVLGKSTYAFMMADPLGVLEENQIHLGFLRPFFDPKDNSQQLELHNIEVLVARSPASLPSDIQKVCLLFLVCAEKTHPRG